MQNLEAMPKEQMSCTSKWLMTFVSASTGSASRLALRSALNTSSTVHRTRQGQGLEASS